MGENKKVRNAVGVIALILIWIVVCMLMFFKAGRIPNYCGDHDGWVKISDVDPRYFSETMLLLYSLAPRENG